MKALLRMLLAVAVLAWLFYADPPSIRAETDCSLSGVTVADNFGDPFYGWYCDSNDFSSQWYCFTSTAQYLCSQACAECQGSAVGETFTCSYASTPGTAPSDAYASYIGCPGGKYGQRFTLNCGCHWYTCDEVCQCYNYGGWWDTDMDPPGCNYSPILVNLENSGANDHLTSAVDGVSFDLNGDGAPEQVAWTTAGTSVGFLAMDRNGNGRIDNGRELFGASTPLASGVLALNGFEALQEFDADHNRLLDVNDPSFSQLVLWIDDDHNGQSMPNELHSMGEVGIVAIGTQYVERRRRDGYGNWYRYQGEVTIRLSNVRERRIFDVFLKSVHNTATSTQ